MPETPDTARERLVAAAFTLFDERGFDDTTVDDIARRAGVGRTTFFRHFGSKEAVIFPEHEAVLAEMQARLDAAAPDSRDLAVAEAARIVLRSYVREGDRARTRYRLITTVAALRDREIAGTRQYRSLFTRAIAAWLVDDPDGQLQAELLASAVVTAHNHVLRRWLRHEIADPEAELAHAMALVLRRGAEQGPEETAVVVLRTGASPESVAAAVRRALDES